MLPSFTGLFECIHSRARNVGIGSDNDADVRMRLDHILRVLLRIRNGVVGMLVVDHFELREFRFQIIYDPLNSQRVVGQLQSSKMPTFCGPGIVI